jgi:hypothetical protein
MIKKCIICGREFEAYQRGMKNNNRNLRSIRRRKWNAVTCSRVCSKKMIRVKDLIYNRRRKTKEQLKAELEMVPETKNLKDLNILIVKYGRGI